MKKKIVPASQKISCLLARISSFFENCLFLIPITFSTSSKIALTKKILFPLGRKSFSNSWILKNPSPLYGKAASTLKNL